MPDSPRISIVEQRRAASDRADDRYLVRAETAIGQAGWVLAGLSVAAVLLGALTRNLM